MATAKLVGAKYTASSIAASAKFRTGEYNISTTEYVMVHMSCTHVNATGGFTLVPVGLIGSDWLALPGPTKINGDTGGITMGTSPLPPYSSNIPSNAAFGYGKPCGYFSGNPAGANQTINVCAWLPVHGYTKLCVLVENYGSVLNNVSIWVSGGTV